MILVDVLDKIGGAERNICMLSKGLRDRGHKVVICPLKGGNISKELQDNGLNVFDLNIKKIYNFRGLMAFLKIVSLIKKEKVSIVLTYHESSDFMGLVTGFITGIPVVSNRRDTGFKLKKRHVNLYKFLNHRFSRIIANSSAVKDSITKMQSANPNLISLIPNGVRLPPIDMDRLRICNGVGLDSDSLNIGCIANVRPVKGQKTLIEAASLVLNKYPGTRFFLIGAKDSDTAYYSLLENQIESFGLNGKIIFLGEVPPAQIPQLIASMDICVLPSLSEGMSNTLLEYMAAGKPVVATSVGGNPDIVDHEENGLLVPSMDHEAMADALLLLIEDPGIRTRLGNQARIKIEREFSDTIMIEKYENLFINLQ